MFRIILIMAAGIGAGWLLRRRRLTWLGRVTDALIWVLLFLLGVEVGGDERIIRGMASLGLEALVISTAGVRRKRASGPPPVAPGPPRQGGRPQMKGSLIIVGFFILGVIAGAAGWLSIDKTGFDISFAALACLMFCVGLGVGNDLGALRALRTLPKMLLTLPLLTITGTLAGCALIALLLPWRPLTDVLAVGSGFGYYSLSSIFITEYRGPELGTVALLANIVREIITLLGAPLLARFFGPLAPVSSGGATSMDTTLPIITRVSGKEFVILSIYHGFVVDFSVPFLVTFFCSL